MQKSIMTAVPTVKYNAQTNALKLLEVWTYHSILRHNAQIEKQSVIIANRLESVLTLAKITWITALISKLIVLTKAAGKNQGERTWELTANNVQKRS